MQGIILAAGMGKRLKDLTKNNTKCMVEVNGESLIKRMLGQLDKQGLTRIVIVVGYKGELLKEYIGGLKIKTPIVFVENPIYDKTNNIYSLFLAKDYLAEQNTILLESDLIFEDEVLDSIVRDPRETLALVDKYQSWMDGTCVKIGVDDKISAFVPGNQFDFCDADKYYKTVNIYKFSKDFALRYYIPFLEAYSKALGDNEYYEQVLRIITMLDDPVIQAKRLEDGLLWYEIDDLQDLDIASSMFADDDLKLAKVASRYGGYWRYPRLLDFCYLVNPYFPPAKMLDEMKASFDKLVTQYPSGMEVNSLLVAKDFGIRQDFVVAGNGAAELIKVVLDRIDGTVGVVRPTFEEYPNRAKEIVVFEPDGPDYQYTADDLMEYFGKEKVDYMVLINPDNPSGNYLCKNDVLRLVEWCKNENVKLIVDESFVDFADEVGSSLLDNEILEENKHLIVIKSISKSFGVPGLRLGVLASGDTALVDAVRAEMPIWNINSFAEFYLQIYEKYKKDYEAGMVKFREERKRFKEELEKIDGLEVRESQANFLMIRVPEKMTAKDVTKKMLVRHKILVKDLSAKTGDAHLMRVAIRNSVDNDRLMEALKEELNK